MPDSPRLKKGFLDIVNSLLADLGSGEGGRPVLTDTTPGSVVRTLVEAFSRELAVAHVELEQVYQQGYLETAEGAALDNVVALLGLERRRGGHLEGTVTFSRASVAPAAIQIPAGTIVSGKKQPQFATAAAGAIEAGQREVTIPVRSLLAVDKQVEPGKLDTLARPLFGIESLTNRVALIQSGEAETDAELRARARTYVAGSNTGTLAAIEQVTRSFGLKEVSVQEAPDRSGVEVVVGDANIDSTLLDDVARAVERVRPAGIRVPVRGVNWIDVRLNVKLELVRSLNNAEQIALRDQISAVLVRYFAGLGVGEIVRIAKLESLVTSFDEVAGIVREPGDARLPIAVPWESGKVSECRQRLNKDIVVDSGQRARIDPEYKPVIALEPPAPIVYVDVDAVAVTATAELAVEALRIRLRDDLVARYFRTLAPPPRSNQVDGTPLYFSVKRSDVLVSLADTLKDELAAVRLTVIHDRDGRVVELVSLDASEAIDPREAIQLRNVSLKPGGG